jgi:3',5'-cyclic AMP phosphodiesterase CpdA
MTRALTALAALSALALSACGGAQPICGEGPIAVDEVAPAPPRADTSIRYVIGGDSRQDDAQVVPWAFHEAKARGVAALIFLGDMELKPDLDAHFESELAALAPVEFLPVLGNHESARRAHAETPPPEARVRAVGAFTARFLGKPGTPVQSAFADKVVYSVDLPGGVHFVALDNVSQPGFGADQLTWLGADLARAHADARVKHVIVGMHKALAGSGVTGHAMEEDGPAAVTESAAALALCEEGHVEMIVASHFHAFAEYTQRGIQSFITGGMGAPLDVSHKGAPFHHVLAVKVPPEGPLAVEVVRYPGTQTFAKEEER